MTSFNIPASVQRLIRRRAKNRCEYCQTSESLSGIACEIDHIIPRAHNGPTTAANRWRDHFAWSEDGSTIVGITACGRATIDALMLNSPLIVVARSMWVSSGQHPPKD